MGKESSGVVRFDLGPLLQGEMRVCKLKSAYKMLFIFETIFVVLFRLIHLQILNFFIDFL